jgi:hypothetical protein
MEESNYIMQILEILLKLSRYFKKKEWLDVNQVELVHIIKKVKKR